MDKKNKTTFTAADMAVLFGLLYKLEDHFEDRRNSRAAEVSEVIRTLNKFGIREVSC
jgi:hypothetical protein